MFCFFKICVFSPLSLRKHCCGHTWVTATPPHTHTHRHHKQYINHTALTSISFVAAELFREKQQCCNSAGQNWSYSLRRTLFKQNALFPEILDDRFPQNPTLLLYELWQGFMTQQRFVSENIVNKSLSFPFWPLTTLKTLLPASGTMDLEKVKQPYVFDSVNLKRKWMAQPPVRAPPSLSKSGTIFCCFPISMNQKLMKLNWF